MSRSSTITDEQLPNPHPGEILARDFLAPMDISATALARAVGIPPRRMTDIISGRRAVTADTDLRLARYFGISDGMFLTMQADFDLLQQRRKIGDDLARIAPRAA